ncbi:MAG TPA: response regulator [Rhodothermales bacterium]|nr:response regulator [Rhodothermales bacterium]
MKILIVDDSPTMRRIVSNALREAGYTDFVEADDGQHALDILSQLPVDLVLTDWNMPNMNGLELTTAIRQHETLSELPILMVTTRGVKDDVIAAMQAGANSYIIKPFTPEVLRNKITLVMKTSRMTAP